jgi:hypothetical protein
MEIQVLINSLATFDGKYKRDEVDEALSRRDEITPMFIENLQGVLKDPDKYLKDPNNFSHIYSVMLLGHFKEKRSHEVILSLFSLPNDMPYELFGDLTTDNLPVILLCTCDSCFDGIKELVLNKKADEFCRGSALRAMTYGVVNGSISREEVLSFFENILNNRQSEYPSHFFDEMAANICDLYPQELMGLIKDCYEDGYIHPGYIDIESFESALKAGKESCLKKLEMDLERSSLEDLHERMSWWACFQEGDEPFIQQDIMPTEKFPKGSSQKKKKKKKMIKASKRKNRKK